MDERGRGPRRAVVLSETLARVRLLATQGAVKFGGEAMTLSLYGLGVHDVMQALANATACQIGEDDVYVTGPSLDGADVHLVVRVGDVVYVRRIL